MIKHPNGKIMTSELLSLATSENCQNILDMGAGDGEAVELLRSLGHNAVGIDKIGGDNIISGDMTLLPFESSSFDIVIAECSFSVCGNTKKAFDEAFRVLKPGGVLCISDVYFKCDDAPVLSLPFPATKRGWISTAASFELCEFHDRSKQWTEFMIHCVWNGLDLGDCGFYKSAAKAKCGYFISSWKAVK